MLSLLQLRKEDCSQEDEHLPGK